MGDKTVSEPWLVGGDLNLYAAMIAARKYSTQHHDPTIVESGARLTRHGDFAVAMGLDAFRDASVAIGRERGLATSTSEKHDAVAVSFRFPEMLVRTQLRHQRFSAGGLLASTQCAMKSSASSVLVEPPCAPCAVPAEVAFGGFLPQNTMAILTECSAQLLSELSDLSSGHGDQSSGHDEVMTLHRLVFGDWQPRHLLSAQGRRVVAALPIRHIVKLTSALAMCLHIRREVGVMNPAAPLTAK